MIGIIIFNLDLKMHLSNGESDCGENDSSLRGSDSDERCALAELLVLSHNIENAKDQIRERILLRGVAVCQGVEQVLTLCYRS